MSGMPNQIPKAVLVTDWEFDNLDIERQEIGAAGLELVAAQCRTPSEVVSAAEVSDVGALLVQYAPITMEVFQSLPQLGMISRYGVGVDNIDLEAARHSGVTVCNAVGYGDEEVATHTAALALSVIRGIPFHDRDIRTGGWDFKRARPIRRVGEMTLGILGLGRIGQLTAARLGPFFASVVGSDPFLPTSRWPYGVERSELNETISQADVLSLHLPLTDETHNLVDGQFLARLPQGAILVNTARGGLVDEGAVLEALESSQLSAVALDVLTSEPAAIDHPLRSHPRALVTPHGAWYSATSEVILRQMAVRNVAAWATGGSLSDVVVGES